MFKKPQINTCETPESTFNPDERIWDMHRKKIENNGLSQDILHRKILVFWVMGIVSLWLLAVLYIIVWRELSDTVKITLLTTTTVNILGLPYIILKGLFKVDAKTQ